MATRDDDAPRWTFLTNHGHVLVNGQLVVDAGRHTGVRSGVALQGPGAAAGR